ncbi:MAG: tetraacyldisaccharide 4'-kinase [Pseudomonadota bacterium]
MREPWFWRDRSLADTVVSTALSPLGAAYNAVQRAQWAATKPASSPIPAICIGGATLGGVGKTPFAMLAGELLRRQDVDAHFVTRGYRGALHGPERIDLERHSAIAVGDEPLLLAQVGPCWMAKSRLDGVIAAARSGAEAVILDDGFQNASLKKSLSILLIDNIDPVGNGRVFPAGPCREPLAQAIRRADAVALVKDTLSDAPHPLPDRLLDADKARFTVSLTLEPRALPATAVAFCGIGAPDRFRRKLQQNGVEVRRFIPFSNHHVFSTDDLDLLTVAAREEKAPLITTEKDFVRLPPEARNVILCATATMIVDAPQKLASLMMDAVNDGHPV